jgi:glycerophosphoryl diester phosphodiesterase
MNLDHKQPRTPKIIGHRGWAARYPENTVLAFERAFELGVAGIECDVRLTADGIPVILHDETLDRTTDGYGPLHQMAWSRLQSLNAAAHWPPKTPVCRVPTLAETLAAFQSSAPSAEVVDLELKALSDGDPIPLVDATVAVVAAFPTITANILFTSFDAEILRYLATQYPEYARGLLTADPTTPAATLPRTLGCNVLAVRADKASAVLIDECHEQGLRLAAWTVNDEATMHRLITDGADYLITDAPDRALAVCAHIDV